MCSDSWTPPWILSCIICSETAWPVFTVRYVYWHKNARMVEKFSGMNVCNLVSFVMSTFSWKHKLNERNKTLFGIQLSAWQRTVSNFTTVTKASQGPPIGYRKQRRTSITTSLRWRYNSGWVCAGLHSSSNTAMYTSCACQKLQVAFFWVHHDGSVQIGHRDLDNICFGKRWNLLVMTCSQLPSSWAVTCSCIRFHNAQVERMSLKRSWSWKMWRYISTRCFFSTDICHTLQWLRKETISDDITGMWYLNERFEGFS